MSEKANNIQTRSGKQVPVNSNVNASPTINDSEILTHLKGLNKKFTNLNTKLDKNHDDITSKLQDESKSIRADLQNHFTSLNNKVSSMENDVQTNSIRVNQLESDLENNNRTKRLNDVVLRGIPIIQKDMFKIFEDISRVIKFQPTKYECLNSIFRIGSRNTNNQSSPIIIQFTTQLYKREFMSLYFKYGQLKLRDIGGNSNTRIYASDNLTKHNSDIHHEALKLLKSRLLVKVQIRSGFIFVQYPDKDILVKINKREELPDASINDAAGYPVDMNNTIVDNNAN